MIGRIVTFVLRQRLLVLVAAALLLLGGFGAFRVLNIEAYPNPVPPMVEVITQPNGYSGEEVERYVTLPLEVGLAGMPGLDHMRSQSLFGLSDVKLYFSWDMPYEKARQEVINRLTFVQLPNNLQPQLSPWNAVGEIFRYTLEGEGYSTMDLKAAQDFILERQFRRVPGVIDVSSFGGETREFHVEIDPIRLRGHKIALTTVLQAIQNANQSVGGQRLTLGEDSYDVRGVGLVRNIDDIRAIVVAEQAGTPVRVGDIANVRFGGAPRLGMIGQNDRPDVVQGIVLLRYGSPTGPTMKALHARLDYIRDHKLLPPGMYIKPYYERGELVNLTTHTVLENLLIGMGLVVLVLLLFLGNWRAALVTAMNIPLALLVAFIGMVASGTSANLLSIGAVDFGIVVDSTVIMMENLFRHLGPNRQGGLGERIGAAAREVATPMAFSTAIICVAFLPLFSFQGVSGVIFGPMAKTYAFAIGGAIILAITLTPTLSSFVLSPTTTEKEGVIMRVLHRLYDPLFNVALRWPRRAMLLPIVLVTGGVLLFPLLGREFMPKLEEGNLWIRATLPMSVSLPTAETAVARMRRVLRGCPVELEKPCDETNRKHPEVLTVTSQIGRPDDGTDVTGFFNIEIFAPLVPLDDLPEGRTKEQEIEMLQGELKEAFPGVPFGFSQMISDNVEEAISGVKGENSVKVFGPNIAENEHTAEEIVTVMRDVRGIQDLALFRSLGQPNIRITPDRIKCARYGLNVGDVEAVVAAAIGGAATTQVFEGEKLFALTVRWLPDYRQSIEALREITVNTPDGAAVPLGQIADIQLVDGAATVYREDGVRYAPVKFSVRGRDLAGAIDDAKEQVAAKVQLPYGSYLSWDGEINELKNAEQRLMVVVPLSLLLITLLAFAAVRSWPATAIVLINIPVACTGGVLALIVTHTHFSVSAAMGFISVFGIAVQDALLMVTYFQRLHINEGHTLEQAAREASEKRFRPVLMTTLVATLGLLPAALSNGIGAQAQKPLAIVVIGGSLVLAIVTRLLQPPLCVLVYRWKERRRSSIPQEA
ncbi:MAG TPA: CusA/CzcA family heavy metal efflux RND transporter [Kofleriaceae bacterium]|nr:CusA/CzcA family heavy metal efflux RND transporter [Kofleriaceae bacterium]